jgi:hypothetical protein
MPLETLANSATDLSTSAHAPALLLALGGSERMALSSPNPIPLLSAPRPLDLPTSTVPAPDVAAARDLVRDALAFTDLERLLGAGGDAARDGSSGTASWIALATDRLGTLDHTAVALGATATLALGLFALLAGGRLARPLLACIAAALGTLIAASFASELGALASRIHSSLASGASASSAATVSSSATPDHAWTIAALCVCTLVSGAVGLALFRPAMALAGAVAGTLLAAAAVTLLALAGPPPAHAATPNAHSWHATSFAADVAGRAARSAISRDGADSGTDVARSGGTLHASVLRHAVASAADRTWARIPDHRKTTALVALPVGAILGLLLGALCPRRVAGAIASLLGAAATLGGAFVLAALAGVADRMLVTDGASSDGVLRAALAAWIVLALLGTIVQGWRDARRPAAASA